MIVPELFMLLQRLLLLQYWGFTVQLRTETPALPLFNLLLEGPIANQQQPTMQ